MSQVTARPVRFLAALGKFLRYFIPAFALFAGVGFVAGLDVRGETVQRNIYQNSKIVSDQNQRYYFSLHCGDSYVFRYSIDSNEGAFAEESLDTAMRYHSTSFGAPSRRQMEYFALLGAFLGGPIAGKTIESFLAKAEKPKFWSINQLKKTIYGIVGGVTGYAFGRWLGSNYDASCESDLGLEALNDREMWRKFEQSRLILTMKEFDTRAGEDFKKLTGSSNFPITKDPIVLCESEFTDGINELLKAVVKPGFDPSSDQFSSLASFKVVYDRMKKSSAYQGLSKLRTSRVLAVRFGEDRYRGLLDAAGYSEEMWQQLCGDLRDEVGSQDQNP